MFNTYDYVRHNENNHNQKCANVRCQSSRFKPKATHYHQTSNSWVCTNCAQSINRTYIGAFRGLTEKNRPPCISSEDYLAGKLAGTYA